MLLHTFLVYECPSLIDVSLVVGFLEQVDALMFLVVDAAVVVVSLPLVVVALVTAVVDDLHPPLAYIGSLGLV